MAMVLNHGQTALYKNGLFGGTTSLAKKIESAWRRHLHYQKIVRELAAYNDRQLADVGIARADIARLARQSASQFHNS